MSTPKPVARACVYVRALPVLQTTAALPMLLQPRGKLMEAQLTSTVFRVRLRLRLLHLA